MPDEIASTEGYGISMQKRKQIEQGFGWAKFICPIRQVMVRGINKVDQVFMMPTAAYILAFIRALAQVRLRGRSLEIALKWGDSTSEATCIVEKRTFTSAARLRPLGISAAC